MYTCIVIDDEFSSLEILTDYINSLPELTLLHTFDNPFKALTYIDDFLAPVDIMFLDIEMPGINGIDLAKLIKHQAKKLVFTTAHQNYAYDSYQIFADGFLLKPFSRMKFNSTIKRIIHQEKQDEEKPLLIKSGEHKNRLINLSADKIIAIEAAQGGTKIYTYCDVIRSNSNLTELNRLLSERNGFLQIHRSFIIADRHIKTLERSFVILTNNLKIPIGRKFLQLYRQLSGKG